VSTVALDLPVTPSSLRVRALPGVWRPHSDARLLAQVVAEHQLAADRDVLDVFTGSGALALTAAVAGARTVTAIDVSRRALMSVRLNARRNGVRVRTRRGDLLGPVSGATFDLILANPPYLPGEEALPTHGAARAWEGGRDGRRLLDRLLSDVAPYLRPGGRLVIVHSSLTGEAQTCERLRRVGLRAEVLARRRGPLGPVGRARIATLRERGLLKADAGEDQEEIVVISGTLEPVPA
jgi:release factor glutamine methyltransferase